MKKNTYLLSSDYDSTISLLNIYFSEWSHRDQMMYTQLFKFFYAILIVIIAPNLINYQLNLPSLPQFIFRLAGVLFSLMFLYFNLGNAFRFKAISDTYGDIINKLPEEYRRKSIKKYKYGKLFTINLYYIVSIVLFLILLLLSIILIFID